MTEDDTPEYYLIVCALNRAILDLFGEVTGETEAARDAARVEALRFLTAESGDWARSRETLCLHVGIDAAVMRDRVVRTLNGDDDALGNYTLSHIEQARAIWVEHNTKRAPKPKPAEKRDSLDDLLELTAASPHTPYRFPRKSGPTAGTKVHQRHAERTSKICDMIGRGFNRVVSMAEHEGVHENTMRDWVNYALHTGHIERTESGVYSVVPQAPVAACA